MVPHNVSRVTVNKIGCCTMWHMARDIQWSETHFLGRQFLTEACSGSHLITAPSNLSCRFTDLKTMNYRPLQHNDRAIWTHSATKLGLRPILHGTVRIEINPNLTCRAFYVKNMFLSPQRVFLSGLFLFPKFCRNLKTHQRALYDDPAPVGGSAQPKPQAQIS